MDTALTYTKTRSQEIVGPEYVRREVRKRLKADRFFRALDVEGQAEVIHRATSDTRLRWLNGCTVGSVVRDAKDDAVAVWAERGAPPLRCETA